MTAACESIPAVMPRQQISTLAISLAIFVLACFCFIFHLGVGPLAGTEGHRAITAEQMLQNRNYLLPRLYGYPYPMKPPLTYWLIAGSEKAMGPSELVWRLPSALSSALLAAGICAITAFWFDTLAGFVAGLAFIGTIALWSQNRSADVDAINHMGCILSALAVIAMGACQQKISAWMFVVALLGTAVSAMSKGPAGLPLILAAAIGPALANRNARLFKRPLFYLAIGLGILTVLIWYLAATGSMDKTHSMSGADEARKRLIITSFAQIPPVMELPLLILACGMPITLLIILPLLRRFTGAFDNHHRWIIRALLPTFIVALVIQMISGMTNPRYAFLDVPILCPIAGAAVYGGRKHYWPRFSKSSMLTVLAIISVAYCAVSIVLIILGRKLGFHPKLWTVPAVIALLLALTILALKSERIKWAAIVVTLSICAAALTFGLYKSAEEKVRSAKSQSAALAHALDNRAPIITWNVLWSQPELFYYAHLHPIVQMPSVGSNLPSPAWLVLDDDEWKDWHNHPDFAARLSHVTKLTPYKHYAFVCWYQK
ncbi:MAG TPA: glycosyltransferase family 39 protein [Tepidisphaeraceae bacterium]|jgi:4-amino-4-deoxy-L-arabinose transferase-like glycosyltransferase